MVLRRFADWYSNIAVKRERSVYEQRVWPTHGDEIRDSGGHLLLGILLDLGGVSGYLRSKARGLAH